MKFKEVPDSLNWFMIIGHYTTQCFGYIGLYIIYLLDYNRYIGLSYPIFFDILDCIGDYNRENPMNVMNQYNDRGISGT